MTKDDRDYAYVLEGKEYEKNGDIESAIEIYEKLLSRHFEGTFPYNRLCILYHKKNDFLNEERVIKRAISLYTKITNEGRDWGAHNITHFQDRLAKLKKKLEK